MAGERSRIGENSPEARAAVGALAALLVLGAAFVGGRAWWRGHAEPPPFVVVEVAGDVPRPGTYALEEPARVGDALRAAGAEPGESAGAPLKTGVRVTLAGGAVRLEPMRDPLVVGRTVDLNAASADALTAIPGIGPARAEAVVADRAAHGAFPTVDALGRVKGFGPATVEAVRPYLSVDRSVDLPADGPLEAPTSSPR